MAIFTPQPERVTLMDKPWGHPRSEAQKARNRLALSKLRAGTLKKGELFELVFNRPCPTLESITTLPPNFSNFAAGAPASEDEWVKRCKDCGERVDHAGPQLAQQTARCRPCGTRFRRKAYAPNGLKRDQPKAAVPVVPTSPDLTHATGVQAVEVPQAADVETQPEVAGPIVPW